MTESLVFERGVIAAKLIIRQRKPLEDGIVYVLGRDKDSPSALYVTILDTDCQEEIDTKLDMTLKSFQRQWTGHLMCYDSHVRLSLIEDAHCMFCEPNARP